MPTDHDRAADVLSRRLHLMVDHVTEPPDALARILAHTVHNTVPPRRTGYQVLAAAAAAAALAGGAYVALPHGNPHGVRLTASEVLIRGARVADTAVSTPPRQDQYEYLKFVESANGKTKTVEEWLPQSATAQGIVHTNGKFDYVIEAWDTGLTQYALTHSTYPNYAFLASLPTDPATVLQAINANGKHQTPAMTPTERSFVNVVGLVADQIVPPKLAASIYRALAALPDITIDQNAVDAAGRHGVAVGTTGADGIRTELIFDPTSFTLIGTRFVPPAAGPSLDAIVAQGIVDSAGQVPVK